MECYSQYFFNLKEIIEVLIDLVLEKTNESKITTDKGN